MSSPVRVSVVCLSVCNVRAPYTQAIEIFGSVFTPFGTLAIRWQLTMQNFTDIVSGKSHVGGGGLNTRGVAKYSDFGPFKGYIAETVQYMT